MGFIFSFIAGLAGLFSAVSGTYVPKYGIISGAAAILLSVLTMKVSRRRIKPILCILLGLLGIAAAVTSMGGAPIIRHLVVINGVDVLEKFFS